MADQDKDSGQETGHFREKLIRRKQDWAAEGRLLTARTARPESQRLPPGQREVTIWTGKASWTCPGRRRPATSIA
jgi:hypothetical protein